MDALILIPTRNRPGDLRLTLDRIVPLLDDRLGLLLVDDASTDPEHLALMHEVVHLSPYVEVVRNEVLHGCTRARKRVLDTLAVPYVIMLDDDSHFIDATRADIDEILDRFRTDATLAAQALPCYVPSRDTSVKDVLDHIYDGRMVSGFINCACAVRMEAYHDIGGYPAEFDSPYGEERDLCIRFMEKGWTIRQYLNPAVIHYQSVAARNKEHNAHGNALNYFRFIWWYHPAWLALPYSASTFVKLIRNGLRYGQSLKGVVEGSGDFLREARQGLERRPVQPETLKTFYSLKRRSATTDADLQEIKSHSWLRVFSEQVIRPNSQNGQDEGRSPRWWKKIGAALRGH